MAYLSVSKLSSFAANPEKYQNYKGGVFNKQAALKGTEIHNKRGGLSWPEQITLMCIVILVLWWLM